MLSNPAPLKTPKTKGLFSRFFNKGKTVEDKKKKADLTIKTDDDLDQNPF